MKNTFGHSISVTIFGESHADATGVVIDGLTPGVSVDEEFIANQLEKRKGPSNISTKRRESDRCEILCGVFNGKTTGTPICMIIKNENQHSKDYNATRNLARPGHADYTAFLKYHGFEDFRGGGHFSGRITAGIVAAGAIAIDALNKKGIKILTHIASCTGINDRNFENFDEDYLALQKLSIPVLDENARNNIEKNIEEVAATGDSIGGKLETAVIGFPSGVGEPWFDSVESMLSHILFSVPAVKGVEFGCGFDFCNMKGSEANDSFRVKDGKIITETNNNGGINGGITNGMPIIFKCAVKPTPSIYKKQETVDFINNKNSSIVIKGRHDPAIVHRAAVVISSVTALCLCDMLSQRFGTDYFME